MLVLFMVVVGLLTFCMQMKRYWDSKKKLKTLLENEKYESIIFGKITLLIYYIFALFAIGSTIFGFLAHDQSSVAMGVILTFLVLGEIVNYNFRRQFYYNQRAFISKGTLYRYRSIKKIKKKKGIIKGFVEVTMINNTTEVLSAPCIDIIKNHTKIKID